MPGTAKDVAFYYFPDGSADTWITIEGNNVPWVFQAVAPVRKDHKLELWGKQTTLEKFLTEQHPGQKLQEQVIEVLGISPDMLKQKSNDPLFLATKICDTTDHMLYTMFSDLPTPQLLRLTLLYPGLGFLLTCIVSAIVVLLNWSAIVSLASLSSQIGAGLVKIAESMAVSFIVVSISISLLTDQGVLSMLPRRYLGSINPRSPEAEASIKSGKMINLLITAFLSLLAAILILGGVTI